MKKLFFMALLSLSISAIAASNFKLPLSKDEEVSFQYRQDRYARCQAKCAVSSSNWYQCMDDCLSKEK